MNGGEVLRIVDAIHREKGIDKELIFESIEQALALAAKKHLNTKENPVVKIDRIKGDISAFDGEEPIETSALGRIAYQAARQLFVQKLREVQSESVFSEFAHKKGDIVTCVVSRFEGPHLVCMIGDKAEATMLKGEQVPGENYRIGDRLRAYVSEVERRGTRVRVMVSRGHEDFVRRLFELEVPEIGDGTVVIKGIAREPGYRTKITVHSTNDRVDCLGACVGVRGSRIRNVVDELNGENVDIVRWSEKPDELIKNSLKPAEISDVQLDEAQKRATVYVLKDQLSQAIGKGGRNVRLASKLAAWEIDIYELGGDTSAPPASATAAEGGAEVKAEVKAETKAETAAPAEAPTTEEKKNEG
ncbi:MAG TPA: transcription termination factor NusA [Planctomycetota bacterium]|nr:transcription termination factor NusA [Planctomycetota bacterium]